MRVFFLSCLLALSITSCKAPQQALVIEPIPSPQPSPKPSLSGTPYVILEPVKGYTTQAEAAVIKKAEVVMNDVVHSQCFYDFMSQRAMIQTNGRSSEEVAKHIQGLSGTVPVVMYYKWLTSAVAYRQPPSLTVNFNRKFFGVSTPLCSWASTLAHEGLGHSLGGYDHDYKWNAQRDYSMPYSANKAFEKCCSEIK